MYLLLFPFCLLSFLQAASRCSYYSILCKKASSRLNEQVRPVQYGITVFLGGDILPMGLVWAFFNMFCVRLMACMQKTIFGHKFL